MASGNMKDIKRRVKSVESTMQITKAMQLVASSKLRKAKARAEEARPFFEAQYSLMCRIVAETEKLSSVFSHRCEVNKRLFIVIAGDRGLAGGYNSNILKLAQNAMEKDEQPYIIAIGKKSVEYFTKRNYPIAASYTDIAERIKTADAADIAQIAIDMYTSGKVGEIRLFFTQFVSPLVQTATDMEVLPIDSLPSGEAVRYNKVGTTYDPSPDAVFNRIIPKLITSLIMCAVGESYASELGARRTSMENATDNAEEMIATLSLMYNRARQEKITNELNEIVSGANAL